MTVDTDAIVSITEANQNFSRIARMADEYGQVMQIAGVNERSSRIGQTGKEVKSL